MKQLDLIETAKAKLGSYSEVARLINRSPQKISEVKRGAQSFTTFDLARICDAVGVNLFEVLADEAETDEERIYWRNISKSKSELVGRAGFEPATNWLKGMWIIVVVIVLQATSQNGRTPPGPGPTRFAHRAPKVSAHSGNGPFRSVSFKGAMKAVSDALFGKKSGIPDKCAVLPCTQVALTRDLEAVYMRA